LVLTDVAVFSDVPMMPEFHDYTTQPQAIYKNNNPVNISVDVLEILLKCILEQEKVPLEWKEGHMVKIPK